jgi:hypothetical protein
MPPDKPSIAVLPFANLSADPEQEYFAGGMAEEIITAAQIGSPRNGASTPSPVFQYRLSPADGEGAREQFSGWGLYRSTLRSIHQLHPS